jgi:serine/threonine protein kinase
MVGTPGWVAPEVLLGAEPNPAADQWALARILYVAAAPFPNTREWKGLGAILERALAPEPEQRFAAIEDLARALRELSELSGLSA